jgi:hypothetical protein
MRVNGTLSSVKYDLDAPLTNIIIEVAAWIEGSGAAYVEIVDAYGAIFRVGFDSTVCKYYDGTWHDSSVNASDENYNLIRVQITSAGVTAWVRGEQICANNAVITSVASLRFPGSYGAFPYGIFYDHLRIWKYVANPGTITLDTPEYHGNYMNATIVGQGKLQNISDAKIAGYRQLMSSVAAFDAQGCQSDNPRMPFDAQSLRTNPTINSLAATAPLQHAQVCPHETCRLLRHLATLPLDSGAHLSSDPILPCDQIMTQISMQTQPFDVLRRESLISVLSCSVRGSLALVPQLAFDIGCERSLSQLLTWEQRGQRTIDVQLPLEVQQAQHLMSVLSLSAHGVSSLLTLFPFDARLNISCDIRQSYDVDRAIAFPSVLPFLAAGSIGADTVLAWDSRCDLVYAQLISFGSLHGLVADLISSLSALRGVHCDTMFSWLSAGSLELPAMLHYDNRAGLSFLTYAPFDSLRAISDPLHLHLEFLARRQLAQRLSLETLGVELLTMDGYLGIDTRLNMSLGTILSYAGLATSSVDAVTPFDHLLVLSQVTGLPLESMRVATHDVTLILSQNHALTTSAIAPWLSLGSTNHGPHLALDSRLNAIHSAQLTHEQLRKIAAVPALTYAASLARPYAQYCAFETSGVLTVDLASHMPFDVRLNLSVTGWLPHESLVGFSLDSIFADEHLLSITLEEHCPFEVTGQVSFEMASHLAFDTVRQYHTDGILSFEQLRQVECVIRSTYSAFGSLGMPATLSVDSIGQISPVVILTIETVSGDRGITCHVSFDALARLLSESRLSFEYAGYVLTGLMMAEFQVSSYKLVSICTKSYTISGVAVGSYRMRLCSVVPEVRRRGMEV